MDSTDPIRSNCPMSTLAGLICCRNTESLDYCWREAGQSLLAVCDELVIADCDSDDGTRQIMNEWADREPRITLCNFAWTAPSHTNVWWLDFLNFARQHAKSEMVFQLDADEILHDNSLALVRKAADAKQCLRCRRLNFWSNAQSLVPHGVCCGYEVVRMGPSNQALPSDYDDGRAKDTCAQAVMSDVQIMHYGFLRKRKAFFDCARVKQHIWTGSYDPRLEAAEKFDGPWATMPGITGWEDKLVPFTGTHPEIIKPWLRERNYDC